MTQQFGKYRATVSDNEDPTASGRLKVDVPSANITDVWAAACLPPVPQSLVQLPASGSGVWVEFEEGDTSRPIWTGILWGADIGTDATLATEGTLTLRANTIEVQPSNDMTVSVGSNLAVTAGTALTATAGTSIGLNAGGGLNMAAATAAVSAGEVDVSAAMSNFSGVVKSNTLVTDSVVSASYTPGAGNVW